MICIYCRRDLPQSGRSLRGRIPFSGTWSYLAWVILRVGFSFFLERFQPGQRIEIFRSAGVQVGSDLELCAWRVNAAYQVSARYPHIPSCGAEFQGPRRRSFRSYRRRDSPRRGASNTLVRSCEEVRQTGVARESDATRWPWRFGGEGWRECGEYLRRRQRDGIEARRTLISSIACAVARLGHA